MVTQIEIARRLSLDVSSVNKILNRRQGPVFRKETIRKVFKYANDMGYDFNKLKFIHRRRHPRRDVTIATEVTIFVKDGTLFDQGVATIRDLSQCGAKINDIALPLASLPVEPFTVTLRPLSESFDSVEIPGRIVRMYTNGSIAYGVDFHKLESDAARKIKKAIGG